MLCHSTVGCDMHGFTEKIRQGSMALILTPLVTMVTRHSNAINSIFNLRTKADLQRYHPKNH